MIPVQCCFKTWGKSLLSDLKKIQRSLILKDGHRGTSSTILVISNSVLSFMGSETA